MRIATAALAVLALLTAGCDVLERMKNEKVMAATLLQPPDVVPNVTGGGFAVGSVFFGQKEGGITGSGGVSPLAAELVEVTWGTGNRVTLDAIAGRDGWYGKTGGGLQVVPNTEYTFTIHQGGEVFTAKVTAPAEKNEITSLDGQIVAGDVVNLRLDQSYAATLAPDGTFTLGRSGTSVAFYAVHAVPAGGSFDANATPKCTNVPQDASGLLQLVVDDTPFRAPEFQLPKQSCFEPMLPGYQGAYVITLTTATTAVLNGFSENLSAASAAMVGVSDAAAVTVAGP